MNEHTHFDIFDGDDAECPACEALENAAGDEN